MLLTPQGEIRLIGHRGAAALAPENTLASFRKAAELGLRWVEMDVSLLADGACVIFHDEVLDRCTNGHGQIRQATSSYLATLDAGSWFSPQFADERIPTLSAALIEIQRLGLGLNLEIKHDADDVLPLVVSVLETVRQQWRDPDSLLLSSFNHQALRLCQQLAPEYRRGQLYETIPADWMAQLKQIDAYSLHCDWQSLTFEVARAIKQAGYRLLCYTVNDPLCVARHWSWGMDAVFTDDPRVFLPRGQASDL